MEERRSWHSNYPPGVGREPRPLPFDDLGELVRDAARRHGDRLAATLVLPNGMETSLSFRELDRLSDAFAAWLRHGIRMEDGERVALMLPNCLAYPICAFGALKAGAVLVNTNPLYTPRELEHQLQDSGAKVLVILDVFADKLEGLLENTKVEKVVLTGIADFFPLFQRLLIKGKLRLGRKIPRPPKEHDSLAWVLRQGTLLQARRRLVHKSRPPRRLGREHLALLQYTGGTTGTSKGAMLTHGNLLANLSQIAEITRGYLDREETVLTVLPLYHVIAFTINLLFGFHSGAHNILVPNPRPLKNLRPAFGAHAITWMTAVNTLLRALPEEAWFRRMPMPRLRAVYAGGTRTEPEVLKRWEDLTGSLVIEGYGLSEASPLVTFNAACRAGARLRRTMPRSGGVGLPLPGTDMRIVDDQGRDVAPGESGEILVKGPQVMRGYWGQEAETARTLCDGWLHTGDVGCIDATGYMDITDRKKDMIIVSGFNVFPSEVEACIAQHPDVADVAVVGVPCQVTGEAVRAFVVSRKHGLTAEELRVHCKTLMAGYKVPTRVSFVSELPKNAVGKALRRLLRAQDAQEA